MANLSGIMQLYTAYFNRAADKLGVDYWANEMDNNGWTLDDVAKTFALVPEYTALYAGKTNAEIVALVYTNVLNRTADTDGAAYWEAELDSGAVTVSQLIKAVVNSATEKDGSGNYKNATDAVLFNNKIQVSQYCYDNNVNATENNAISLSSITTDASSVSSVQSVASTFIDNNNDTNTNIGIPIYMESKISTDEGNDGSIDWITNFTYSYENGLLNQYSDGNLQSQYIFNSNGLMIEERNIFDGVVDSIAKFIYNSNGQFMSMSAVGNDYTESATFEWSENSLISISTILSGGQSISSSLVGTGLNSTKTAPLKVELYYEDELESVSYYTYDENGNEITMLDDEDADGIIDYAYHTEWILLG